MKQMEAAFSIGDLAQQVRVNVETIRYYERIGLMARPKRSSAGRRLYQQSDLQTLRFVRQARELGFSLDDIRSLLTRHILGSMRAIRDRDVYRLRMGTYWQEFRSTLARSKSTEPSRIA
jgi:DNA-binding transcriptional MerR regulator